MQKILLVLLTTVGMAACNQAPELGSVQALNKEFIVCAKKSTSEHCDFVGGDAIQKAVDSVDSGSTLLIKAGVYQPQEYRDTTHGELLIRGFTMIENKQLTIIGEGTVVIDGALGTACGFVAKNSDVNFKNMHLNNFRWGIQEDDIYDGHGIFVIDGSVNIDDVSIRKTQKMALSIHGSAKVNVNNVEIINNHLGLWANDTSIVNISRSKFINSESAGIAAYQTSKVLVDSTVFQSNQDDGIFASDEAYITVKGSVVVNNKPFGVNLDKKGVVQIDTSFMSENVKDFIDNVDSEQLHVGPNMLESYPSPLLGL